MLFSEPKISQCDALRALQAVFGRFSALQRAENFSIQILRCNEARIDGFSALQRAENFSIVSSDATCRITHEFQCSSASRKFLNAAVATPTFCALIGFSALQRAENFSIVTVCCGNSSRFRFQCSSASRKFLNQHPLIDALERPQVSVLFSEPKISQFNRERWREGLQREFQCSSASRKFLNRAVY